MKILQKQPRAERRHFAAPLSSWHQQVHQTSPASTALAASQRMESQQQSQRAAFGSGVSPVQRRRDEEQMLQDEEPAPEVVTQRAEVGGGAPNLTGMPNQLKSGIEALSDMDMSAVRVHRNSDKPAHLKALAYAQGNDIHLGPGQEKHLPHEAWHVVQQRQGRVRATMRMAGMGVNDEMGLEREANLMGQRALLQGGTVSRGQERDQAVTLASSHGHGDELAQCVVMLGGVVMDDSPKDWTDAEKKEFSVMVQENGEPYVRDNEAEVLALVRKRLLTSAEQSTAATSEGDRSMEMADPGTPTPEDMTSTAQSSSPADERKKKLTTRQKVARDKKAKESKMKREKAASITRGSTGSPGTKQELERKSLPNLADEDEEAMAVCAARTEEDQAVLIRRDHFPGMLRTLVLSGKMPAWKFGTDTYHLNTTHGDHCHVTREGTPMVHFYYTGHGDGIEPAQPSRAERGGSAKKKKSGHVIRTKNTFSGLPKPVQLFVKEKYLDILSLGKR